MQDITKWFSQATEAIPSGQMVKQPSLGLLDAMNALHMLDPKMDTGMSSSNLSSSSSLFSPYESLLPEELCWIMDRMTALEVAWYKGGTLCQTVFTCLYYHNSDKLALGPRETAPGQPPTELILLVLNAYVLSYSKTIDLVYTELVKGHVNDGEDCWLEHYGLPVHMADTASDVLRVVQEALDWLQGPQADVDERWRDELIQRLTARAGLMLWLDALQDALTPADLREMYLNSALQTIVPAPDPRKVVLAAFDDTMPSYLRQNMPLPPPKLPSHGEGLAVMRDFVISLGELEEMRSSMDLRYWEMTLVSKSWAEESLPILRSLYKTVMTPSKNAGPGNVDLDTLFGKWLAQHVAVDERVIFHFDTIYKDGDLQSRRQYAIWKDLTAGYNLTNLTVPLLNRARQARQYQKIALEWRSRAMMAQRFGGNEFESIARALHGRRLDCLLESALAAWDLDLIVPSEERESWWWVKEIASARANLQLFTTWQSAWASFWGEIAHVMMNLLTAIPVIAKTRTSREVFDLRHKTARKSAMSYVPEDVLGPRGLKPEYDDWILARDKLDGRDSADLHKSALSGLAKAQDHLTELNHLVPKDAYHFQLAIRDLQHQRSLLSAFKEAKGWDWAERRSRASRRWIPRLAL